MDKYLTFKLRNKVYGVPLLAVREIAYMMPITKIAGTDKSIKGVINIRGKLRAVLDLGEKLGMPECVRTDKTVFIIVQTKQGKIALIVDTVEDAITLNGIDESSFIKVSNFYKGLGQSTKGTVIILDLDRNFLGDQNAS